MNPPSNPIDTTRRTLLTGMAGLGLAGLAGWPAPASAAARRRRLVLIELNGGNDALNTFPPQRDPLYRRLRPTLAVPAGEIIAVTPQLGWHPSLKPLLPVWEAGELALVQGVGYAEPILSHFESGRIWETGQRDPKKETGWITQALSQQAGLPDPAAVIFGFNPGPLRGYQQGVLQLHNLSGAAQDSVQQIGLPDTALARHLREVQGQTEGLLRYRGQLAKLPPLTVQQQRYALLHTLRNAAAILSTPDSPVVCKLILGGFDTHAGQLKVHGKQLARLADGLVYFRQLLMQLGLWDDVLVVTYSEFGRRVGENASGGTDHGTAQTQIVMGRAVQPGLHGPAPDLAALDADGNLKSEIDFRGVYNRLATQWLDWNKPFGSGGDAPRFLRA